jgi:hypothetical protein
MMQDELLDIFKQLGTSAAKLHRELPQPEDNVVLFHEALRSIKVSAQKGKTDNESLKQAIKRVIARLRGDGIIETNLSEEDFDAESEVFASLMMAAVAIMEVAEIDQYTRMYLFCVGKAMGQIV